MENEDIQGRKLIDKVLAWSFQDVLNNKLYKGQVDKIPVTFESTKEYTEFFVLPLIEETHADLCSSITTIQNPPTRQVMSVKRRKGFNPPSDLFYKLELNCANDDQSANTTYKPEFRDLVALTHVRPRNILDLKRPGQRYLVAYVRGYVNDNPNVLSILSSDVVVLKPPQTSTITHEHDPKKTNRRESLFAFYLTNMVTNIRIYEALNSGKNMKVLKQVLHMNPISEESCAACCFHVNHSDKFSEIRSILQSSNLNDSQESAILVGINLGHCWHRSNVKLIWGPPGTGKTKTTGLLLFCLLKMKCRTLCAPTNIAVLEVTKRLLKLVMDSLEYGMYGLGDIVLFGNNERMKIGLQDDLARVFLDHRLEVLDKCLAPCSGYTHNLKTMISLLEDPEEQCRLEKKENEERDGAFKKADHTKSDQQEEKSNTHQSLKHYGGKKIWKRVIAQTIEENKNKDIQRNEDKGQIESTDNPPMTFMGFVKKFNTTCEELEFCMVNLCTHMPTSLISLEVVKKMTRSLDLLRSLKTLLTRASLSEKEPKHFLSFGHKSVITRNESSYT